MGEWGEGGWGDGGMGRGGWGGGVSSGPLALFGFKEVNCLITPGRVAKKKSWCAILRFYRLNLV